MRSPPKSPPAHTRSSSSIKPAGTAPWNSRSRPTLAPAVAAALTRAQQPRKYLAIHAPELAIEPHLQILRRYRRSLLLRLEHPHRPAMEDHVHRTARLGLNQSVILRIGIRHSRFIRKSYADLHARWARGRSDHAAMRREDLQRCLRGDAMSTDNHT